MAYTQEQREQNAAMLFLGTWGSTSYPPVSWEGFAWTEAHYAPEWLSESEIGAEHDECCCVLSYSWPPRVPDGYRLAYQYQCGEADCPDCHGRKDDEPEQYEGQPKQSECPLCEGDGVLYWGEEWSVLVLAPRYSYGSGSAGCLYDNGPHLATSLKESIESLTETFADLPEEELRLMGENLRNRQIHYFSDAAEAGADYCEIQDLGDGL